MSQTDLQTEGPGSAVAAEQPVEELALERAVAHDEVLVLDYGGPVLAADRPPRARVRRVLGAAAAPRRRRARSRKRDPKGLILSGGPASVYAPGAPRLDPELLELGIPVLGICYGMQALVLTLGGRVEGAEVGEFGRSTLTVAEPRAPAGRHPGRAAVLDVAPRHRVRGPARLHGAGELDRVAGRRGRGRLERGLYGIQFHPEVVHTPYGQQVLTTFLEDVCGCARDWSAGLDHRRADRRDPRPGRRRPRDLRALRRRRLVGRRAARAPRGGRPADLRVRRPRADAQERGRPGDRRLPRPLQGPARGGRRRGSLPRAGCTGLSRARGQAQGDRRRVHPRLRGGGGQDRRRAAISCRARCTRT